MILSKDYLVISDQHAHPDHNNDRADWLGQLIMDLKPEVVVNIGDAADMPSLSSYDKGKATFQGRNYEKDIEAHLDFQDRLWAPMRKAKRKQPQRVFLYGNHEQRLQKVLEYDPHLSGDRYGVSFDNYAIKDYYHEEVHYKGDTPGVWQQDGVSFAHYMVSGVMGRAIEGDNHARSLLTKNYSSCVVGHSHKADYACINTPSGQKLRGVVCGVYQDYITSWAGVTQELWWRGLVYLHGVENGAFDPEFISLDRVRQAYG